MKLKVLASGSKGNCYILQGEKETLLLECGIHWKEILKGLNFNISNVIGCLISHEHKDHSKAIRDVMGNGIDVYTSCGTMNALGDGLGYRWHPLESERLVKIGQFWVLPFKIEHDAAEPLGFLIEHSEIGKLLFITDSYYCKYRFTGIRHIMIECNYSSDILKKNIDEGVVLSMLAKRLLKSHFSLENVKEFLMASDLRKVSEIILIHLSDTNSNTELFKREIQRTTGKPVYFANKGFEFYL